MTATPTQTTSPTPTTTTTLTATQTQTSTPTQTRTQTPTTTTTLTATPTQTSSPTQTSTPTQTRTQTPTPSITSSQTQTPTPSITSSQTMTPTNTTTPTQTNTPTRTATNTPTPSSTNTPTPTRTATPTQTMTQTPTATVTASPTNTPTQTPSHTPTNFPIEYAPNGYYYDTTTGEMYISTNTTKRVIFDGLKVGINFLGNRNETLTVNITDSGFRLIGLSEAGGQYVLVSDDNGVMYYALAPGGTINQDSFVSITGGTVVNNTWFFVGDNNSGSVEIVEIYNIDGVLNQNRNINLGPYSLVYSGSNANQFRLINTNGGSSKTIETANGGTVNFSVDVAGNLVANSKSFLIDNKNREGYRLRHGSVEGPENGVYFRGNSDENIIELPDYWKWMVDSKTITVLLTSYCGDEIYVEKITESTIIIGGNNCGFSYVVYGERNDIGKMDIDIID